MQYGRQGQEINRVNASVISGWANLLDVEEVLVTSSDEVVGEGDLVLDSERKPLCRNPQSRCKGKALQFFGAGGGRGNKQSEEGRYDSLMGAQGMNRGQDVFWDKMNVRSRIKRKDITSLPFEYHHRNIINPS